MSSSRIRDICDRAVIVAASLWAVYGVTVLVVSPKSAADVNVASQTTMLGGYFIILSALFLPLYLYGLCLLVERLSRRPKTSPRIHRRPWR